MQFMDVKKHGLGNKIYLHIVGSNRKSFTNYFLTKLQENTRKKKLDLIFLLSSFPFQSKNMKDIKFLFYFFP